MGTFTSPSDGDVADLRRFAAQAAQDFLSFSKSHMSDYAVLVLASALVDYMTAPDGPPIETRKDAIVFACRTAPNRRGLSDALRHAIVLETFVATGSHDRALAVTSSLREQFETIEQVHDMRSRAVNPPFANFGFSITDVTEHGARLIPSWRPWSFRVSPDTQASIVRACAEDQTLSREAQVGTFPSLRHWVEGYECGRRDASQFSSDPLPSRPEEPNNPHGMTPPKAATSHPLGTTKGGGHPVHVVSGNAPGIFHSPESSVHGVATGTVGEGGRVGNDSAAGDLP